MDFLDTLAHTKELPALAAFALGLLTAISPCPLTTNITATAYIAKSIEGPKATLWAGLAYTLGRSLVYLLILLVLGFGASQFELALFLQTKGERFLGPILLLLGLFMLGWIPLPKLGQAGLGQWGQRLGFKGYTGAFGLGILFALAFCPYSGALFFGALVPLALQEGTQAWLMGLLFSIGTALPVLFFAYLLAFSAHKMSRYFKQIQTLERYVRKLTGILFLAAGLYFIYIFFFA